MTQDQSEEAWASEQRQTVRAYLEKELVKYREIGEWPAWHVHPVLAIWAVESAQAPGRVGWWAVSGDVPTDYVSFADADHPRKAMLHFIKQWDEVSSSMLEGKKHPHITIGSPDQWPVLGNLLERRAELMRKFANDHSMWEELD